MKEFGVDISKWQSNFNFTQAKKEGVKFVVLRGAYTTSKDTSFEKHYKNAKKAGLNVGCYIYSMATNTTKAKEEAKFMIDKVLKGKQFELPIYFDIEDAVHKKLSKKTNTAIVKAFCETLEKAGYWVGIYSSKSFFTDYLNDKELQSYAHWVAQWSKSCTYKGSNKNALGMWQFGGETNLIRSTKVSNCNPVDQDYMLIDYPSKIKAEGKNGFSKQVSKPVKTTKPTTKPKTTTSYYKKCAKKHVSLVDALNSIGVGSNFSNRSKIARKNGIKLYIGSAAQNTKLLNLLKQGKLKK